MSSPDDQFQRELREWLNSDNDGLTEFVVRYNQFPFRVRGRSVKLAASYGGIAWIDLVMEPLKIINAFLRPFSSSKIIHS